MGAGGERGEREGGCVATLIGHSVPTIVLTPRFGGRRLPTLLQNRPQLFGETTIY